MIIKKPLICALTIAVIGASSFSHASWFDKIKEVVGNNVSTEQVESVVKSATGESASLSTEEISAAFKQALEIGSKKVVDQLATADGFNGDSAIRIPLPEKMQTVKKWLGKVGLGDRMDDLEVSLNRAAENATPKAKALFVNAIKAMSFDDVRNIYSGGDNAATEYFREKMTPELSKEMEPLVQNSLAEVGAVKLYDDVMGDYKNIPFVPDIKNRFSKPCGRWRLDGIFHYLAQEEAAIRQNPVKRTTELLERVFGAE